MPGMNERSKEGYEGLPQVTSDVQTECQERQWHGHWVDFCGLSRGCSWLFCRTCLVTHYFPCVSFGLTARRAFNSSAWIQGLFFLSLLMAGWTWYSTEVALESSGCMLDPTMDGFLEMDMHREHRHHLPRRMGPPAGAIPGPLVPLLNRGPVDGSNPRCVQLVQSANWLYLLALFSGVMLTVYGARRRTQLREKFGIPGSRFGDLMLWFFCKPCALCQEARTVEYNNVHNGVWHGAALPEVVSAETQTMVPAVPVMSAAAADAAARKL